MNMLLLLELWELQLYKMENGGIIDKVHLVEEHLPDTAVEYVNEVGHKHDDMAVVDPQQ